VKFKAEVQTGVRGSRLFMSYHPRNGKSLDISKVLFMFKCSELLVPIKLLLPS
jgi:hypothetical protein